MDIGRRQNADPRWILPLLCRRGHITRNEIGAIRIAAEQTFFQVPRRVEAKFRAALQRTARPGSPDEDGIQIEPSPQPPAGGHGPAARHGDRPAGRPNVPRFQGKRSPPGGSKPRR